MSELTKVGGSYSIELMNRTWFAVHVQVEHCTMHCISLTIWTGQYIHLYIVITYHILQSLTTILTPPTHTHCSPPCFPARTSESPWRGVGGPESERSPVTGRTGGLWRVPSSASEGTHPPTSEGTLLPLWQGVGWSSFLLSVSTCVYVYLVCPGGKRA